MHDGQVEISAQALAAAVAAQFPGRAENGVHSVRSAGTVIAPFRVGSALLTRLGARAFDPESDTGMHVRRVSPRSVVIGSPHFVKTRPVSSPVAESNESRQQDQEVAKTVLPSTDTWVQASFSPRGGSARQATAPSARRQVMLDT
jgi:hypothetical protein